MARMSREDWVIATWCTVVPVLLAFAAYGFKIGQQIVNTDNKSLSMFCTAKKKFGAPYLIPAFTFAFLGSRIVNYPGQYASTTGVLGLCMLAVFSGIAVVTVAMIGKWVKNVVEGDGVEALSDFVNARFGPLAELYVALLVLFNTAVLLIAEYSTIRFIFIAYVGTKGYAIILLVGFSALLYSCFGGLMTTMKVNPLQAVLVGVLCIMMASYVGATFQRKVPDELTDEQKGYTPTGYSSIIVQPIVLIATAFFNEALWQKCWSSANDNDLKVGSLAAGVLIVGLTLAAGFMSLSAQWTGLVPSNERKELYFFHIFDQITRPAILRRWIGIVVALTATIFSQANVAALQMGITCTVCSYMLRGQNTMQGRFTSFIFNVPIIAVASTGYEALPKLYRLTAMICSISLFPVAAGAQMQILDLYTGDMMLFSIFLSFLGTSMFGVYRVWDSNDKSKSFEMGMSQAWWTTQYQWKFFLIAVLASVTGVVCCIVSGLIMSSVKVPYLSLLSPTNLYKTAIDKWGQLTKPAAKKKAEK